MTLTARQIELLAQVAGNVLDNAHDAFEGADEYLDMYETTEAELVAAVAALVALKKEAS